MTTPANFDRVLQAWLGEAAPSSAPADLHARAMGLARRRRQRVAWTVAVREALTVRPSGRVSLVVRIAAVTILTLLVGLAFLAGIGQQPTPPVPVPSPSTSPSSVPAPGQLRGFLRPFSFVLPAGEEVDLQPTNSHLFRISGPGGRDAGHGVSVVIVDAPRGHPCGENGGSPLNGTSIRDTPAEFLADFEAAGGLGVALTDPTPTTLDGYPALQADRTQRAGCEVSDLHVGAGVAIGLKTAARMVVADIEGITVLVDVWALTDEQLESWLPAAMEFVDSIDFFVPAPPRPTPTLSPTPAPTTARVDDFLRPFSYNLSDEPSIHGERANSRLFRFGGSDASSHPWGVSVAVLDSAVVHECRVGSSRANIRVTPAELIADLEAIAGIALTDPTPAVLDGNPALMTTRTQSSLGCGFADVHISGDDPDFFGIAPAGQSLVADIDGLTVFVDIWSRTDAGLEAWLPAAMLFVESIDFIEPTPTP